MKHLIQTNHQCLLYSAAMVLDLTIIQTVELLGHDGLEEWWPQAKAGGYRRLRGHHIQEIVDLAYARGYALVPIQALPMQTSDPTLPAKLAYLDPVIRFYGYLKGNKAIIIGETEQGDRHACAWDGYSVFDPADKYTTLNDFSIKEAWVLYQIQC